MNCLQIFYLKAWEKIKEWTKSAFRLPPLLLIRFFCWDVWIILYREKDKFSFLQSVIAVLVVFMSLSVSISYLIVDYKETKRDNENKNTKILGLSDDKEKKEKEIEKLADDKEKKEKEIEKLSDDKEEKEKEIMKLKLEVIQSQIIIQNMKMIQEQRQEQKQECAPIINLPQIDLTNQNGDEYLPPTPPRYFNGRGR